MLRTQRHIDLGRLVGKIRAHAAADLHRFHPRLGAIELLLRLLPQGTLAPIRSRIYRLGGFRHVDSRVVLASALKLSGDGDIYPRLRIGEGTFINAPCYIELSAPVSIGRNVGIGNHLTIVTSTHEVGGSSQRMQHLTYKPVTIGDGAWIGAQVTILPGVTIGEGAFVTAGAVVTRDVPPNAQVAGNHAQIVGWLDPDSGRITKVSRGNPPQVSTAP